MEKRIKAHKGGRTERVYARLTPEEKERLMKVCEQRGLTVSDFLVWAIDYSTKINKSSGDAS